MPSVLPLMFDSVRTHKIVFFVGMFSLYLIGYMVLYMMISCYVTLLNSFANQFNYVVKRNNTIHFTKLVE